MIKDVISWRWPKEQAFRDVSYEWDDETARFFGVPVRKIDTTPNKNIKIKIKIAITKLLPVSFTTKIKHAVAPVLQQNIEAPLSICHCMFHHEVKMTEGENCIPVFIDVWHDVEIDLILHLN